MWRTKWLRRRGLVVVICISRAWALTGALAAGLLRRLLARLLLLVAGGRAVGCLLLRLLCSRVRKASAANDLHRLICVMSTHKILCSLMTRNRYTGHVHWLRQLLPTRSRARPVPTFTGLCVQCLFEQHLTHLGAGLS